LVGSFLVSQAAPRDGNTLLDKGTNLFRFVQRRYDSALDLGRVIIELGVAFREDQSGSKVPQERPLVVRIAAEFTAFLSMSHGCSIDSRIGLSSRRRVVTDNALISLSRLTEGDASAWIRRPHTRFVLALL
jgi:hypothetical protein